MNVELKHHWLIENGTDINVDKEPVFVMTLWKHYLRSGQGRITTGID